jgi:hypothetical protein
LAIVQSKENNLDSLIAVTKAACERIKEINGYIDRLKNKIKVVQGDPNLAYYEYTCSELEQEKIRIANSLFGSFKEIIKYNRELQGNYERLQKSIEIQQIMNRYCARALKGDSNRATLFKKNSEQQKKDIEKILKEQEDIALKMQETSPIVDIITRLLDETGKKQHI